jgi:amino-acid N-acetyltransferase
MAISQMFVLTVQASHWVMEKGYIGSSLEELPIKRQSLYNFQRNSKVFCKKL